MARKVAGDEPWEGGGLRLFLAHVDTENDVASSLKADLSDYGVNAFVAHADIKPGNAWPVVLESAIRRCDALAGLLHEGFHESEWCDQEVGLALGCNKPVVPIHYDLLPYGFISTVQAIRNAASQTSAAVARNLVLVLLKEEKTSGKLTKAIVNRLADAYSFDHAKRLAVLLDNEAPMLTKNQVNKLRKAQKENSQLRNSWHFDSHLSSIEDKIEAKSRIKSLHEIAEAPF